MYVDDYIGLLQSRDEAALRHHSRALLHAVHQIFPPPAATGHHGEDPISQKKLIDDKEGLWDTIKEILGWMFDGMERTMQLPEKKVLSLRATIKELLHRGNIELKAFESFLGKVQHGCMGIPGGTALLPPLYKALQAAKNNNQSQVKIHKGSAQFHALSDLRTIFKVLGASPIKCARLLPGHPAYIGHCDACKYGAGGIWLSGLHNLHPIVWRCPWPQDIVDRVSSGELTINDLEMAGVLLQYLLLEQIVDVTHLHTAVWCDNTSAVSWTMKMSSKTSAVGQQLTRALTLRMLVNHSSHLAALSIAGIDNDLADLASRSFKKTGVKGNYDLSDTAFFAKFNSDFPLPQDNSWLMLRLSTKLASLVFTVLRGEMPPVGSWLRLTKSGCDIGLTGNTSAGSSTVWTPFSATHPAHNKLHSSRVLPVMSVKGMQDEDIKSGLALFRTRFAPSARPSNWTSGPTPPTKPAPTAPTGNPSATC